MWKPFIHNIFEVKSLEKQAGKLSLRCGIQITLILLASTGVILPKKARRR